MQASLANSHGYSGLTMNHLRADPRISTEAAALLAQNTSDVAPLQALQSLLQNHGNTQQFNQVNSVDQLYKATTVNKQLRCYEFAATAQFSYRQQLKQNNCNAAAFAFGAFKHLEACLSGLIKTSDKEFLARIRHLKNVFEIACLSSSLNSFSDPSWLIAREYDTRIIADIESGAKSWDSLAVGIEPDAIYCAKETVESRNKSSKKPLRKIPIERKRPRRPVPLITLIRVQKDVTGNILIKEKLAFLSMPVPGAN